MDLIRSDCPRRDSAMLPIIRSGFRRDENENGEICVHSLVVVSPRFPLIDQGISYYSDRSMTSISIMIAGSSVDRGRN